MEQSTHQVEPGELSPYLRTHPEVVALLHPSVNDERVLATATKSTVLAWSCQDCGALFEATVSERTRAKGWQRSKCATCGASARVAKFKQTRLAAEGTLANANPAAAAEWASDLNRDLTPADVSVRSAMSVWWRCEHGHEEHTRVYRRTQTGCTACNRQTAKRVRADNYWATHPEVVGMLFQRGNAPVVLASANKETDLVWACPECGSAFHASIADRTRDDARRRDRCDACSDARKARRVRESRRRDGNTLVGRFPTVAAEWASDLNGDVTPADITPGNNQSFWWRCELGHTWAARVANRTLLGRGCPECNIPSTSMLELRIFTSLNAPDGPAVLRAEVDGFEADIFLPRLNIVIECDGYPWHDDPKKIIGDNRKDEEWARAGRCVVRVRDGKLQSRAGHVVTFEDRGVRNHLDIVRRLMAVLRDINREDGWLADCEARLLAADDFPQEAEYKRLLAQGVSRSSVRLAAVAPQLAAEWDVEANAPLTPDRISFGSSRRVWWVCSACGHRWEAVVANRASLGRGCPVCARARVQEQRMTKFLANGNTLADKFPAIAAEWDAEANGELHPESVTPFSPRRVWWVCSVCGHRWGTSVGNRTGKGSGCPRRRDHS
ncbi:MAG: zinc-ribbon domain-containing protein [Candidatus Nanopelagicales bacterium]